MRDPTSTELVDGGIMAPVLGDDGVVQGVVVATGWGAGIDEGEARQRGVSGVVPKPYRRADLHAVMVRVLAEGSLG